MKNIFLIAILILPLLSSSQNNPDCYAEKDFLIIISTRDYASALLTAQKASKSLNIKLDLGGLIPDKDTLHGLTLPVDSCIKHTIKYGYVDSTCYYARGRYDDGIYISIEYTNSYYSFSRDYYIVMVGSGIKNDQELKSTLKLVRAKFPDAYIKTSKVYMCCTQ